MGFGSSGFGFGFWLQDKVSGSGFRVSGQGFGFRVSDFGFWGEDFM